MRRTLFFAVFTVTIAPVIAESDESRGAFFEKKIRPVLVEHCYRCHSSTADSVKGKLLLDSRDATLHGGESGPAVVPGKPSESLLLSAMRYESFEMPPDRQLPQQVIADFEKWIRDGSVDPRRSDVSSVGSNDSIDVESGRKFWAFQRPALSKTLSGTSATGSDRIDELIEKQLKAKNLNPNSRADRRTLLRRMFIDITGLPPTFEEVQRFVKDDSSDAFEKQVDSLLDSSTYGQRWARMWLDVSRYAEDQAHIVGNNKSLFYPNAWRYRDWVIKALNSDMPYDRFLQLQLAADLIEPETADDQPALGFIGLGPKYYRRNDPEVMAEEWEDRVDVVSRGLQGLTVACARCHDHKYDPIATEDYYALAGVFASTEMFNKPIGPKPKEKDKEPQETLHVIRDGKVQDLAVMIRGKVDNRGDVVPRGFLQVMFPGDRRQFTEGSGRRELADSITDSENPLTARVIVNRIWAEYFGAGLVQTPSNFGQLGERPTHPELLDDLAVRFMQNGWSLKWLQRQIVLSDAYQRSSDVSASVEIDPENKSLWRMPRRRLSIEAWRDSVLFVAGRLDADTGGKSMSPDDPEQTRRTVYSEVSRFDLNPLLARFDFPDPNVHSASRVETNTPLQKLFMLNNPFMLKQAGYISALAENETKNDKERVERLFQIVCQRLPEKTEVNAAKKLLEEADANLEQIAQTLIASNEFWYID